jgi:threonylcarbamoyladenosine tRNA methylthiotransferase MtaB
VVVAGCATAVAAATIQELEGVAGVVPGQDPAAVAGSLGVRSHRPAENEAALLQRSAGRTRAWLKVQDGCDLNCSYCVIRVARGRSRSRPPEEIVQEARLLAEHHPEVSLTGIHIGLYGKDLRPRTSLSALLDSLLEGVPGVRFRIGSLECSQLDDHVIGLMEDSDGRLAPHLHVPLQSGSDRVLRLMRRAYVSGRYLERVDRLCERVWPLGLGTDVIVGFPGESDTDHKQTLNLIERLPYTYVHVFPYSDRSGTDAVNMPDRVAPSVRADRSREIRQLVRGKAEEYRRRRIDTPARVVLEGDDMEIAVTGDYLKIPAAASLRAAGPRLQPAWVAAINGELRAEASTRAA